MESQDDNSSAADGDPTYGAPPMWLMMNVPPPDLRQRPPDLNPMAAPFVPGQSRNRGRGARLSKRNYATVDIFGQSSSRAMSSAFSNRQSNLNVDEEDHGNLRGEFDFWKENVDTKLEFVVVEQRVNFPFVFHLHVPNCFTNYSNNLGGYLWIMVN